MRRTRRINKACLTDGHDWDVFGHPNWVCNRRGCSVRGDDFPSPMPRFVPTIRGDTMTTIEDATCSAQSTYLCSDKPLYCDSPEGHYPETPHTDPNRAPTVTGFWWER